MPVSPAAFEVLRALLGVLPRFGDWYLFGAQAVIAYGVPRLSADVDVTLRLVPDVPDRLVGDMRAAGFEPRVPDADFVRRTRVLPFVHASTGMPLDLVLAGPGLEDEFRLSDGMPRLCYLKTPAPDVEPRLAELLGQLGR